MHGSCEIVMGAYLMIPSSLKGTLAGNQVLVSLRCEH